MSFFESKLINSPWCIWTSWSSNKLHITHTHVWSVLIKLHKHELYITLVLCDTTRKDYIAKDIQWGVIEPQNLHNNIVLDCDSHVSLISRSAHLNQADLAWFHTTYSENYHLCVLNIHSWISIHSECLFHNIYFAKWLQEMTIIIIWSHLWMKTLRKSSNHKWPVNILLEKCTNK